MSKWTPADDARLTDLFELWPDPAKVPLDSFAGALGRTPATVRTRAVKLGLLEAPEPAPLERTCAHCQRTFTVDRASNPKKTCGRSCAAKQRTQATRGRFGGRSRVGKRADLDGMFFRSSWEANYARYLNHLVAAGEIVRWEYEPEKFSFPVKRGNKAYLPDFRVWLTDDDYEWHEVKGYMDDASRIKLRRFALHHTAESARLKLIDRAVYQQLVAEYSDQLPGWET